MNKIISTAACLLCFISAKAQYISLSNTELKNLSNLIQKDTSVANVYQSFTIEATNALSEQPNPIEKITSQGLLEGNPAKTASLKAVKDADKVYALALVYRLKHQQAYLQKAGEYLMAWANTNQPTGDPIDETKLEAMITGYDLIRSELPTMQSQAVDQWLTLLADDEVNSASAKPGKGTAINNWNSHRIKIITLIAYTLHNKKYDDIIKHELEKQIAVNLNADGTSIDFVERDAFHYHTYDLEPLLTTITAINRATGINYFNYESDKNASIKKSVDFMIPYMTGEKQHGEFVNSKVEFDKKRAANHEKGYIAGTPFDPNTGILVFVLASYFDKAYATVPQKAHLKPNNIERWQQVLSGVRRG